MDLKLPELGEGVHEGELVKWLVKVGDVVKDDQLVCEIMTDKATIELPAPFHGKVTKLAAKEGQVVHVGQVMLEYEGAGASASAASASASAPAAHAPAPAAVASAPAPVAAAAAPAAMAASAPVASGGAMLSVGGRVTAAPATRKLAREAGVDITSVPGSGPSGRVMKEDVERLISGGAGATAAGAPTLARAPMARPFGAPAQLEERVAFKGLRKKIAEKMRQSKDKAAHFTYVEECDATALVQLRAQAKDIGAKQGVKVTFLPFVMKAMVAALRKYPILNATLDEQAGEIVYRNYYNVGLSIQTEDGLTAPNVKNVESKSVLQLAKEIQELVDRARAKKLTQEDFAGGTITLTNAGSIGGLFATPVINFPEVAILGFNKIFRKPVVVMENGKETIAIRDWTYFSISLDHRIVDGAMGAEFMNEFIRYIQNPSLLILEG
jgi:pyruvate dehydrogenase E2 component (dihydrolipoamide acetyltransferase)